MINIISLVLRWIANKFLSLILITVILMLGSFVKDYYDNYHLSIKELPILTIQMDELKQQVTISQEKSLVLINQFENATLDRVNSQLDKVNQEIKRIEEQRKELGLTQYILGSSDFLKQKKLDLVIIFLKQEQDYLSQLSSRESVKQELVVLRKKHVIAYHELKGFEEKNKMAFWVQSRLIKIGKYKELYDKNHIAYKNYQNKLKQLRSSKPRLVIPTKQVDEALALINQRIASHNKNVGSVFGKIINEFSNKLLLAIPILIVLISVPILLRAIFYYVFAPLASRRPPICIFPDDSGVIEGIAQGLNDEHNSTKISAVSIQLNINKNQELLIHSDYVQSSSIDGRQDTKWLLSNSLPLSSILSGMLALSRVRTDSNETIVISSSKDPLIEIGTLSLPEGSAMVLQPHCLIGVLQKKEFPLHISRHWRLLSLQAWLTLQLRYLVFHGPATLIIKGCRGIRVEKAGNGRRISQAATVGFSSNLKYSTTPSETFFPYLIAQKPLLNDIFTGDSGFYVYEELLGNNTKSGIGFKGLEGVSDAVLKVFGI
jgi:hypothetical protein